MPKCPKCSSEVLMDHLRVLSWGDGSGDLMVEATANPGALVFRDCQTSRLEATVCGGCGYTELFALNPKPLVWAVTEAERRMKQK